MRQGMIIVFEKGSRESTPLESRLNLPAATSCMLILDGDAHKLHPSKTMMQVKGGTDFPEDYHPALDQVLKKHDSLFSC